jgi:hypothetical protein
MLVGQEIAAGAHPIDDATGMASSSSPMPRRKRQTQAMISLPMMSGEG